MHRPSAFMVNFMTCLFLGPNFGLAVEAIALTCFELKSAKKQLQIAMLLLCLCKRLCLRRLQGSRRQFYPRARTISVHYVGKEGQQRLAGQLSAVSWGKWKRLHLQGAQGPVQTADILHLRCFSSPLASFPKFCSRHHAFHAAHHHLGQRRREPMTTLEMGRGWGSGCKGESNTQALRFAFAAGRGDGG